MGTHHKGTTREVRALDTYIKLMRCANTLDSAIAKQLADWDLTLSQLAVLEALLHLGELTQSDLCRKMLRSGGSVTSVLDNLERKGWVERHRAPDDRRISRVRLTSSGKRLISKVFPDHARQIAKCFEPLTAGEQIQLGRLCRKLGLSFS